jgi:hypothetical protein
VTSSFFLDYALTAPPDGIRAAELPLLFYTRTLPRKKMGNKITWDPDLRVVFNVPDEVQEPGQPNFPAGAVAGGVIGGVAAIAAIAGSVLSS